MFACALPFKDPHIIPHAEEVDGRFCPSHPITFLPFGASLVLLFFLCFALVISVAGVTHAYAGFRALHPSSFLEGAGEFRSITNSLEKRTALSS